MRRIYLYLVVLLIGSVSLQAQQTMGPYQMTNETLLKTTPVKDQNITGACWSFATISFLEAEAIRLGKPVYDLSEMYIVRLAFSKKADRYIRFHGNNNFSQGGQAHDVIDIMDEFGIVPEEVYPGLNYGNQKHDHSELEAVLKGFLTGVKQNSGELLTTAWSGAFNAVLDVYLGKIPEAFKVDDKTYNPKSFMQDLKIMPEDYIEITSYTHHPYYTPFVLEIPDNWSGKTYYNLPIDELVQVMDNAIKNGYTVAWDGDVSDEGFSHKDGMAIVPVKEWGRMSQAEKKELFTKVIPERKITQEMRQQAFDNYTVTDDHLMHMVGCALDQNGTKYYITKNSWGASSNNYNGYDYISESYVFLNTIAIMVHKDAVPKEIAKKLGL